MTETDDSLAKSDALNEENEDSLLKKYVPTSAILLLLQGLM